MSEADATVGATLDRLKGWCDYLDPQPSQVICCLQKALEMNAQQTIFHITHLSNLLSVIAAGGLMADSLVRSQTLAHTRIGYEHIKQRRLQRPMEVASRGFLGDYVPFNFCPRSVMLYVIKIGNVPGYDGGQDQVIHLVSTIERAIQVGNPWAFTDRHADVGYALYFDQISELGKVDWQSVAANQWGGAGRDQIKERKQAEFLVHQRFPWEAILQIGVKLRKQYRPQSALPPTNLMC